MKAALVAVLVAVLALPCVAQTTLGELEKVKQQLLLGLREGDATMLARISTEHAILMPPNAEMIEGRDAIEKYWRSVFAAGLKDVSVTTIRVDEYGDDAARELGRIHLNASEPRDALDGKYVIVWRKIGESWLLDSVIWNFTQPAIP